MTEDQFRCPCGYSTGMEMLWQGHLKRCSKAPTAPATALEALRALYEETADYIRINNLGDVHHNRSMQMAREVLAAPEKGDSRE